MPVWRITKKNQGSKKTARRKGALERLESHSMNERETSEAKILREKLGLSKV